MSFKYRNENGDWVKPKPKYTGTMFANALKGSKSGTVVTIDDASPVEHELDIKLKVPCKIESILDMSKISSHNDSIALTNNGDGTLTLSGNLIQPGTPCTIKETLDVICPGLKIGDTITVYYEAYNQDSTPAYDVSYSFAGSYAMAFESVTYTITADWELNMGGTFWPISSYTLIKKFAIGAEGNEPLINVSTVNVISSGSNLIQYPYYTTKEETTTNGITFKQNADRSITISGTATAAAYFLLAREMELVSNLNSNASGTTNGYYSVSPYLQYNAGNKNLTICINKDVSFSAPITVYPMVVAGNTIPAKYEPYIEPITFPASKDGTVKGITPTQSTMVLTANTAGVTITANYNRDINKAFAKLEQAILNNI